MERAWVRGETIGENFVESKEFELKRCGTSNVNTLLTDCLRYTIGFLNAEVKGSVYFGVRDDRVIEGVEVVGSRATFLDMLQVKFEAEYLPRIVGGSPLEDFYKFGMQYVRDPTNINPQLSRVIIVYSVLKTPRSPLGIWAMKDREKETGEVAYLRRSSLLKNMTPTEIARMVIARMLPAPSLPTLPSDQFSEPPVQPPQPVISSGTPHTAVSLPKTESLADAPTTAVSPVLQPVSSKPQPFVIPQYPDSHLPPRIDTPPNLVSVPLGTGITSKPKPVGAYSVAAEPYVPGVQFKPSVNSTAPMVATVEKVFKSDFLKALKPLSELSSFSSNKTASSTDTVSISLDSALPSSDLSSVSDASSQASGVSSRSQPSHGSNAVPMSAFPVQPNPTSTSAVTDHGSHLSWQPNNTAYSDSNSSSSFPRYERGSVPDTRSAFVSPASLLAHTQQHTLSQSDPPVHGGSTHHPQYLGASMPQQTSEPAGSSGSEWLTSEGVVGVLERYPSGLEAREVVLRMQGLDPKMHKADSAHIKAVKRILYSRADIAVADPTSSKHKFYLTKFA